MLRSWDSSPQSLTTTQEQLTTLRALPSRSIWPVSQDSQYGVSGDQTIRVVRKNLQRPAHSPSCLPSGTLIRGILCSPQRATTSFL